MKVNVISCSSGEFFGILDLRDSTVVLNAFPIESKDATPHPARWVKVPIDFDLEAAVKHALEQVAEGARRQGMDFVYSSPVYISGVPYIQDNGSTRVMDVLYLKDKK